ncbi:MAG: hypothetical protein H0U27_06630 [Nitrosopumilus sp.]|nr:hypothetical protein [Nitrosopumilus sp.]
MTLKDGTQMNYGVIRITQKMVTKDEEKNKSPIAFRQAGCAADCTNLLSG